MRYGVCLEMVLLDKPLEERIALVGQAGYRFAEVWFMDGRDPAALRAAAEKAGVTLTNAVIGSPDGGVGGGLTVPAHRKQWLARTDATFALCREAGIRAAIVCTGNLVPGRGRSAMRRSVLAGLKATAERAEEAGMDLFLEPLNDKVDHGGYFLTSSDEAAELCREVGSPRMKVVFDCYHMQIMEGDLTGHIRKNLDVIGHIHSAGHPGRHELWLGETNYAFLAREVEKMGYGGVFALEYSPTLPAMESLRKTLEYLTAGGGTPR